MLGEFDLEGGVHDLESDTESANGLRIEMLTI
jgi:hypothetical protein